MRFLLFAIFLYFLAPKWGLAAEKNFPPADVPSQEFLIGETLRYSIRYLRIPIGEAVASVKEIKEIQGRRAYHIEVHVRSYPVIDFVYKVRDEHHSYVDIETLQSLRYEKKIQEGPRRSELAIEFDPVRLKASYFNQKGEKEFEMDIPTQIQDQLSCGYWFRTLPVKPHSSVVIPVNADRKNWELEVKTHGIKPTKLKGVGRFQALEAEPFIDFEGIFVKKGRIKGWVSLDERRIPLKMRVKVPVLGSLVAELSGLDSETILRQETTPRNAA